MLINMVKPMQVDAKELRIHMKVCDQFCGEVVDQNGQTIGGKEDVYVPDFMPEQHFGDYLILNIDLESGRITNWKQPTADQIEAFVSDKEEE